MGLIMILALSVITPVIGLAYLALARWLDHPGLN